MEAKYELSSNYIALLDQVQLLRSQIRYLLSRENLCNNTYLFKQMKPNLTLPLFLIAEERKIAAITNNEQLIINVSLISHRPSMSHDSPRSKITGMLSSSSIPLSKFPQKNTTFFKRLRKH